MYSEAEYLAGADEFGEWHRSAPGGDRQERPLRRLGAAAALTGALGALGGVIVFAGVGVRTSARDLAANGTSAKGGELLSPRRIDAAPPAGGDRPRGAARRRHAPVRAWRGAGRSARRRRVVSARAAHSASPQRSARSAAGVPAEPVGAMPAVAYDATRGDAAEREARPPTQSEFGFER